MPNIGNFKYDWESIREEYVLGYTDIDPITLQKVHKYPTLKVIQRKHGMNYGYLKERSSKESWNKRQMAVKAKLREINKEERIHTYLSDSAQFDAMTLINLKKLYKLIDAYWARYNVLLDEYADTSIPLNDEDGEPVLKVLELKTIVDLMEKAQALVRRTVGEPLHLNRGESNLLAQAAINPFAKEQDGKSINDLDLETKITKLSAKREASVKNTETIKGELEKLYKELDG
jgi:hypothetical protein